MYHEVRSIDRNHSDSKKRGNEQLLSRLAQVADDAIVMLNDSGMVTFCNFAAERMLGYSFAEMSGVNFHRLFTPARMVDDAEKGFAQFRDNGLGALIGKTTEVPVLHRDGSEYWVASKSGKTSDNLLQVKAKSDSWKNVVVPLNLPPKSMGARFSNALNANIPTSKLSEAVVDELFLKDHLLDDKDLGDLRRAGATNQELIIATVIATKTKQSAKQLYLEVKAGTKTWGSLLSWTKIDTKNMQQEVAIILKLHPQ